MPTFQEHKDMLNLYESRYSIFLMTILLFLYIRDQFSSNERFLLSGCSWPVRTLSFSHDGEMLASGSEDLIIDIVRIY